MSHGYLKKLTLMRKGLGQKIFKRLLRFSNGLQAVELGEQYQRSCCRGQKFWGRKGVGWGTMSNKVGRMRQGNRL